MHAARCMLHGRNIGRSMRYDRHFLKPLIAYLQLMNAFLTKTYNDPTSKPEYFGLVLVRSCDEKYEGPENLSVREGVSASSFKGKSGRGCYHILRGIR